MDLFVFYKHLAPTERMSWKEDEDEMEEGEESEEGKTVCWPPNKFLPIRFVCHLRPPQKHLGHYLSGYVERTNAPIGLPYSEEAPATLKHFKNQHDEVY